MDEELDWFVSNKITDIGYDPRLKNVFRFTPFAPFHFIVSRIKNPSLTHNSDIKLLFLDVFSRNYD